MVRVVNEKGTAHANCNRCGRWVECARCPSCRNTTCVPCYEKPPPKPGEPLIPGGSVF